MAEDHSERARRGRRGAPSAPVAPLEHVRPAVLAAALYAVAILGWLAFGGALPGGRWTAVHLFTLGVLTNLVLALTQHFAETLLHGAAAGRAWRFLLVNAGVVVMATAGLWVRWAFALGATAVATGVAWLYRDLRRMRKVALGQRFAFVVRGYERACGAFLHGAVLGVLVGLGVFGGAWWGTARLAHLHLGVLGWGGFTLLATVVFFGPTMMRTRIRDGADVRAARALRHGMTALSAGALLLLASGAGSVAGTVLRVLAAVAFAGYAASATVVCRDVIAAGRRAKRSLPAASITLACGWFVLVVWADALVIGLGAWHLLDALGAVLLAGVLGQAILASLGYLAPMLVRGGQDARSVVREGLDVAPVARVAALNLGVVLVAGAVLARGAGGAAATLAARTGWVLVTAVVLGQIVLTASAFVRARAATRGR